jgi:maltose O-acetyltransferase
MQVTTVNERPSRWRQTVRMTPMESQKQRMLSGEAYFADDPELRSDRRRAGLATEELNACSVADLPRRRKILVGLLGALGDEAEILSPFHCDYGYQITVGARTFINFGAVILDSAPVRIGDDVQIGPGVQLVTPTHPLDPAQRRTLIESGAPIQIGDGAWLAAGVIVCPGVTVGTDTVVGAGSVVTRDLPAGHLCVGNPCRVVRELAV